MGNTHVRRILGIDPGLRTAGYGCVTFEASEIHPVLVEAGAMKLDTTKPIAYRLHQLWKDISAIISDLSPDLVVVESVFSHAKHVSAAITLGHARGVILLAAEQANLPLIELAPAEIKKAVSGNGQASKSQVQQSIATILQLTNPPDPPDVADALAIAFTGAIRAY
ncbi:MAG: crossover junction endodeoxyribonuclease RuvC [Phycisphaerales bacterium]|jgi:crossover junction endodeoxyribonuclease RuvC|nr:crossover junction endodeoxyribonuclease RuvC [Phycisphaerales bacterium]